jgi:DNA mismatch endonuclease, patch repair protein
MADSHSKEIRSYNMSQIKSKNTKPEITVRKFLFAQGFRFRIHVNNLPGKPDIVLPRYKAIIFVHGCFWHGHEGCKYFVTPKTRTEWWVNKINTNINNHTKSVEKLLKAKWRVIVVWECELKSDKVAKTLKGLVNRITSC